MLAGYGAPMPREECSMPKQKRYPGIIAMPDGRKRIRLRAVDPRTGRMKEVRVVTVPMEEDIVLQQQ